MEVFAAKSLAWISSWHFCLFSSHSDIRCLSNNTQLDISCFDLTKAFDTISHDHMLHKLSHKFNIHCHFLPSIKYYLPGRQRHVLSGAASQWCTITSAVLQGSVRGPLPFVLFKDTIWTITVNLLRTFVCMPVKVFKDTLDDVTQVQSDILIFSSWCNKWQLKINTDKCSAITISLKKCPLYSSCYLNTTPLVKVSSQKDLCVLLDSKLTFEDHFTMSAKKSYEICRFTL